MITTIDLTTATDRDGFRFIRVTRWDGIREWNATDALLDTYIEHAATKAEARARIKAQRAGILDDNDPDWVAGFKTRLAAHRAAYDARH